MCPICSGYLQNCTKLRHQRKHVASELLYADNWTANYQQTSTNGTGDFFKGGFSRINKWAIYSWMRDMVYYN